MIVEAAEDVRQLRLYVQIVAEGHYQGVLDQSLVGIGGGEVPIATAFFRAAGLGHHPDIGMTEIVAGLNNTKLTLPGQSTNVLLQILYRGGVAATQNHGALASADFDSVAL